MKITRRATFKNKRTGEIKVFHPGSELGTGWDLVVRPEDRVIYVNRSELVSGVYQARKELVETMIAGRKQRGAR